jgi:hypothetical protein
MHLFKKAMFALMFAAAVTGCAADGSSSDSSDVQITSAQELSSYLQRNTKSPLDRLSAPARERFLDSLVFSENGLGSYHYADLEAELSVSEVHAVLSLFGVEHTTSMLTGAKIETPADSQLAPPRPPPGGTTDYKDFRCKSIGTCTSSLFDICTTNC